MFRRILIATDGSRLSRKAIRHGIALARTLGASVVGHHARPPSPLIYAMEPIAISPADSIIRTAKREKCDLVVMASHGRHGLTRVLLGSETMGVLTHSGIPVLVTR